MSDLESDRKLIADLGGPTRVAELMGFSRLGGPQRVQNWMARGIPPRVKLNRPDLFLRHLAPDSAAQPAAVQAQAGQGA